MVATKPFDHSPPSPPLHHAHPVGPPPQKIPRPRNPWIIYRSERLAQMKEQMTQEGKLKTQASISKDLAFDWAHEPATVKAVYAKKSEIERAEHKLKYPGYKYDPKSKKVKEAIRMKEKLANTQLREAAREAKKALKKMSVKKPIASSSSATPPPFPATSPWVDPQSIADALLQDSSIQPPPFPDVSPFAAPEESWSNHTSVSQHDSPPSLSDKSPSAFSSTQISGGISHFRSPPPSTFDEAAARMSSWTYSDGQQADFTAKFDPQDYISQWPTLEVGPYDELLNDGSSGISSGPFDFSLSNPSSDPSSSHVSSQFSTPDLSIRMQMPVPQHMLNSSHLLPSHPPASSPFDFSFPTDNSTPFDFISTAEPSSIPFAFNLDINPRDIDEDGAIHLNWGLYQDDGKSKDHAQLFYEQIASNGNGDDSYESDSDPDAQDGNDDGGGGEDNDMSTYDTSQQLFSMNDTDNQGATHTHPAASYGFDMLGLGYSGPSSPPTTTRNFTGPIDHGSEPSPSVSSQRNFTGPIDLEATEYNQLRNYTGPIDMALLEQLQQQPEEEHDPEKKRSFSGSSGETLRQSSPPTDDIDGSNSIATVRQPYMPPRGAANNSRRVGGTFHTNYSLRATSGGSTAAASPSSPSPRNGTVIARRGALDFSGVDPLDRGPHPDPIFQSSHLLRSHR